MFESLKSGIDQLWPPPPTLTEKNVPSQRGKVFVVTGGSAGIGFELCKILHGAGAKVYMASRSRERAEQAIESLQSTSATNPGEVIFLELDLNDLHSVKRAAEKFMAQETKLDILWNNATATAFVLGPGARTAQGIEALMGVNCVAHLLLAQLLLGHLRASTKQDSATPPTVPSSTRVVWLSSIGADDAPLNGIDLELLDKGTTDIVRNYQSSKAGNWILAREFARRYGGDGIWSVAVNPGNVKTGSYTSAPFLMMLFMNRILKDPKLGAYTELWAGLSPDVGENGGYVLPWGRARSDEQTLRQDILRAAKPEDLGGLGYGIRFWEWCERQWEPVVGKVPI